MKFWALLIMGAVLPFLFVSTLSSTIAFVFLVLTGLLAIWPDCRVFCILPAFFLITTLAINDRLERRLPISESDRIREISGVIASLPESRSDVVSFVFLPDEQVRALPTKIRVNWYKNRDDAKGTGVPALRAGERWRLNLKLRPPRGRVNFHGVDAERWFFTDGIDALAHVQAEGNLRLEGPGNFELQHWRESVLDKLAEEAGDAVPSNLTSAAATTAGDEAASADPALFGDALGSIKDFFGDLFDMKELKRMAILYLGARVSGASHGASLGFAGKSYLSRVEAKETAYNNVAASGEYTRESVEIFKETRDYNDLALKAVPSTMTGVLKTFYDDNGNEVRAQQMQNGDNRFYVDGNGNQINPLAYSETAPDIRTAEDREGEIQSRMPQMVTMVSSMQDRMSKDPETGEYSNDIIPEVDARKIVEFAEAEGIPFEEMGGIVEAAYHDMENASGGGRRVRSLIPFIRQNVIRHKIGANANAFVVSEGTNGNPPEYVAPHLLETLNRRASGWLSAQGAGGSTSNLSNQFYTAALSEWNALTADERESYTNGAGEGSNGFYEFADTWLRNNNF